LSPETWRRRRDTDQNADHGDFADLSFDHDHRAGVIAFGVLRATQPGMAVIVPKDEAR
jgi:hypothetical protein